MIDDREAPAGAVRLDTVQALADALPGALFFVDTEYRIAAFNAAAVRLSVELTGEVPRVGEPADRVLPASFRMQDNAVARSALQGEAATVAIEAPTTAGTTRSFEVSLWPAGLPGQAQGLGLLFHDVSEYKSTEQRLRRTEGAIRQIMARTPIIVFAFDREGVIRFADGGGLERAGVRPEDLVGSNIRTGAARLEDLERDLPEGIIRASLELGDHLFDVYYAPVQSPDGELSGYIGSGMDATEREARDRKHYSEQKRQSLERLAHGLAHELGNALTVFVGNASMLRNFAPEGPMRELAGEIVEASWRTNAVIRQLLFFADGPDMAELEPVDLNTIADETVRLIRGFVPAGVALNLLPEADLDRVEGSSSHLRELVSVMLSNAVEAVGSAGSVRVISMADCDLPDDHRTFTVPAELPPRPRICLRIEDDGPGMDRETLEHIVDPYFTTKFAGRGLGLAHAYGILRAHGGGLHFRSVPGEGTAVTAVFPAPSA